MSEQVESFLDAHPDLYIFALVAGVVGWLIMIPLPFLKVTNNADFLAKLFILIGGVTILALLTPPHISLAVRAASPYVAVVAVCENLSTQPQAAKQRGTAMALLALSAIYFLPLLVMFIMAVSF